MLIRTEGMTKMTPPHQSLGGQQVVDQPLHLVIVHLEVHHSLPQVGVCEPVQHGCERPLQVLLSLAQQCRWEACPVLCEQPGHQQLQYGRGPLQQEAVLFLPAVGRRKLSQ